MSTTEEKLQRMYGGQHGATHHKWIEAAKAEAHRQGIRNEAEAMAFAERDWQEKGKPYVDGHPNASSEKVMAYRSAINRPRQSDEVIAERGKQFLDMRTPLAETRKERQADALAVHAEQCADPIEGKALRETGLGGDTWYAHLSLRERREGK